MQLATLSVGTLKPERLTADNKRMLSRRLMQVDKLSEECVPLKI